MSARIRRYPKQSPTLKFGCVSNRKSYTKLRIKEQIRYEFSETDRGARIRLVTSSPETTDAVHAFLLFQIVDRQTQDAPTISDDLPKK